MTVTVTVAAGTADTSTGDSTKIWGAASGGRTETIVVEIKVRGQVTGYETRTLTPDYTDGFINVQVPELETTGDPDTDGDGVADGSDNCPLDANTDQADADGDHLGNACDSNSYAPAVGLQAAPADGKEGQPDNPTTTGSFTDQDGAGTLDVSMVSDDGSLVDNGDGTFSWSIVTTDDAHGAVTVQADDGEHAVAQQSFTWTAANVAPVVGPVVTRSRRRMLGRPVCGVHGPGIR